MTVDVLPDMMRAAKYRDDFRKYRTDIHIFSIDFKKWQFDIHEISGGFKNMDFDVRVFSDDFISGRFDVILYFFQIKRQQDAVTEKCRHFTGVN